MIRPFAESDSDGVIGAWYAASVVATPFLSREFLDTERENIRNIWLHEAETWVCELDGRIAGFLSLIGNEVGAIFVDPNKQGQGIGKALMDHAAGMHSELVLDVFEENVIGRRFYDRYGFQFEDRHVHPQSGHMQLRLRYRAYRQ